MPRREIPAPFIAVISLFSDNAPIVIMELIRMAKGRAMLTNLAEANSNSLKITHPPSPLPNSSSRYTHMNCISKMNIATKKVTTNGPI
jgi:hypothetical protein